MKKSVILALALFAAQFAARGQESQVHVINFSSGGMNVNSNAPLKHLDIGNAVMEFTYDYAWAADTTDMSVISTDVMLLQVGNGISKFFSYRTMQADSLLALAASAEIAADPGRFRGGESYAVYKNHPAGKFTYTDRIASDWFSYEEEIPGFGWEFTDGSKTIEGYECRRAECDFRGRRYVAWYTEEIPVADGPWKFGGLPGFIMEVSDTAGYYSFVLTGISKEAERTITIPDVKFHKTSRPKLLATKRRYEADPIGYMAMASGVNITITTPDGQPNDEAMKPREPKYDFMERDYK